MRFQFGNPGKKKITSRSHEEKEEEPSVVFPEVSVIEGETMAECAREEDEDGDVREEIADEYAIEEDIEPIVVPEDDCRVFEDDDTELAEENEANLDSVEEQVCPELSGHLGDESYEKYGGDVSDADSGDEIWNDESIPDPLSSDDDEETYENRVERANVMGSDELLRLGKTYGCAEDFKLVVLRYSLKTGLNIKMYKSSAKRLGAMCAYEPEDPETPKCPWRVYCSYERRKRKLQTKVYINEHNCIRSGYTKMLKVSTIALLFSEKLRINPQFTSTEMVDEIKKEYNMVVTDNQCSKAKTKLFRERKRSHEDHFSRLWDYQAEIFQSNPGTTMEIETIPGPTIGSKHRFNRLYVCFKAQRESWLKNCRPIIGIDGAFLKWDIKGQLLAAIGRDGDNRIVPIAWAVVEIENTINWEWFLQHLKDDLKFGDGRNITIISDKQKGLVAAVQKEIPEAEHRMCARHILGNWKTDGDMELETLFWKIARSYTMGDFEDNMEELRQYSSGAYETLQRTNPTTWARAFFRLGSYCNDNLNNLSEVFNKTIREARKKPLLEMLEDIRRQTMVRNAKRFLIADKRMTKFTKRVHQEIDLTIDKSKECIRYMATGDLHEVDYRGHYYRVDMGMRTCGCRQWQMIGIPCIHATCVIIAKKMKVESFVVDYYTTQKWRATYVNGIEPVQGQKLWPRKRRLPVLPPPYRKGNPGRPSNYDRRKGKGEVASKKTASKEDGSNEPPTRLSGAKRVMTCSNCREEGHNILTCKNQKAVPQAKRPRGRPKKSEGRQEGLSQEGGSQVDGSQVGGSQVNEL